MTLEEFAQTTHDHADEMAWIIGQILDCQDGDEWDSLKREGAEACRKWQAFSQSKEAVEAI